MKNLFDELQTTNNFFPLRPQYHTANITTLMDPQNFIRYHKKKFFVLTFFVYFFGTLLKTGLFAGDVVSISGLFKSVTSLIVKRRQETITHNRNSRSNRSVHDEYDLTFWHIN